MNQHRLTAQVTELAETVATLASGIQTIMSNQNNLNARLNELEARQDPAKHNAICEPTMPHMAPECPQCGYEFCECEEAERVT